ncbi:MAG: hypothetical protein J6W76_01505, partial [Spirochaetales bacterium]|nr:hypothetical protein [Spirochaetales bacterium]
MTKVSKGIVKSFLMIMLLIFSVWACSNEDLISSASSIINGGITETPVINNLDSRGKDKKAAVMLKFNGSGYGAVSYNITAVCLSDKRNSPVSESMGDTSYFAFNELPVGKYQFTVIGYDEEGDVRCVGTATLQLEDDVDLTAFVSLIEADNTTIIEESTSADENFLLRFVDTLCVGETKNVQLSAGDNWFGFIAKSSKTLFLSWLTDTSVQNVIVYKDGRAEDNEISCVFQGTEYSVTTSEGEHCYYVRLVATQAMNHCQLTLTDTYAEVPTTTTTTIYIPVTTTSTTTTTTSTTTTTTTSTTIYDGNDPTTTTTTSSTTTTTTIVPTERVVKPVISYSQTTGKVTITCATPGASILYTTSGNTFTIPDDPSLCWAREDVKLYKEPFEVAGGVTIYAAADAQGYLPSKTVSYTTGQSVLINIDFEADTFEGIRILVAKNLGYPLIHYFRSSNANLYPDTTWPGTEMASYDNNDYCYDFTGIDSIEFLITNNNKQKLYGSDMKINALGTYRVTSSGVTKVTDTPTPTPSTTTTTTIIPGSYDGIQIQVSKSLANGGWDHIHYWSCSDAATYPATSWPGKAMDSTISDEYYIQNFDCVSSVNVLITNTSGGKLCSNDIELTKKGCYLITASGASASSYITTAPKKSTYTMSTSATLNGSFVIRVVSNAALSASTVSIGGKNQTLKVGDNSFAVSEFTSSVGTLAVSGTLTNEAGSTSVTGSITIKEAPQVNSDFNSLTIYQVMVSSFQDGDKSRGYNYAYGPQGALTKGDLQGIIDAADYIKDLGCNAIWMTPIFDSSSGSQNEYLNSTGYFTYDYFNIDPKFGTKDTFKTLVETYHNKGMYVILDGVFGHWGDGDAKASPTGKRPTRSHGQYKACDFPASLPFFEEVAQYWIKEYKIDGWRLDQCYQVGLGEHANGDGDNSYTGGHNYWYEIRKAVEAAADYNKNKGETWGTLGYMVGEHWMGDASIIQKGSVAKGNADGYGLRSCFDFPARYKLVQAIATEESREKSGLSFGEALTYTYGTYQEKGYVHDEGYYPNLFVTNHDLVRLGNLINWKFSESPSSSNYWGRHRVAMA